MQQFNLDTWLQDKSRKVVTRDGREVDIYYSPTSRIPLIGRTSDNEIHQYTEDGFQYETMNQAKNDIFFADNDELTEFEKAIYLDICTIVTACDGKVYGDKELKPIVKGFAKVLLDLARKEFQPEFDKEIDKMLAETDKVVYQKGREDALKDLPKLEKTEDVIDPTIPVMYTNAASMKTYVEYNGYTLCINDAFEKLPKEE